MSARPVERHLDELLAQWHDWRAQFRTERGYARVVAFGREQHDDEYELMELLDELVELMPRHLQLALQHDARALALGLEVFHNPHRVGDARQLAAQVDSARLALRRRLLRLGLL